MTATIGELMREYAATKHVDVYVYAYTVQTEQGQWERPIYARTLKQAIDTVSLMLGEAVTSCAPAYALAWITDPAGEVTQIRVNLIQQKGVTQL